MEDHEVLIRHLGGPVCIELGEDKLQFPRFNIEEFGEVIDLYSRAEQKESEIDLGFELIKLLIKVVERKFKKDIDAGKVTVESCQNLVLDNATQFIDKVDDFMPKYTGTRLNQKAEELLKKREDLAKPAPVQ